MRDTLLDPPVASVAGLRDPPVRSVGLCASGRNFPRNPARPLALVPSRVYDVPMTSTRTLTPNETAFLLTGVEQVDDRQPIHFSRPSMERCFVADPLNNVGRWCDVPKDLAEMVYETIEAVWDREVDRTISRQWQIVGCEGRDENGEMCYTVVPMADPSDYGIKVRLSEMTNLY